MKDCVVCGHENIDDARNCSNCGSELDPAVLSRKTVLDEGRPVFFELNSLISERYHIVRELGRGGMGVVYLIKDTHLNDRQMALKMIHPELVSHEEARQRFMDEVILCLDMFHPNIVRINNLDEWENALYFTMEYIPGQNLRQLIETRKDKKTVFNVNETIQMVVQILDALSYAHQTTIHRDIKPENILVQGEFPDIQVKVLDFGIAKILSASRFTRTAQAMGTAYYMAPEQMQGAKHIDHRSDLYAVGMILYEMLTGELAVGRFKLPGEMVTSVPKKIDRVIDKVLSTKPEGRYDSAQSFKEELTECLSSSESKVGEKLSDLKPDKSDHRMFQQEAIDKYPVRTKNHKHDSKVREIWKEPVTGMEFVRVPGGSFNMGFDSGKNDEKPAHEVCLSDFWMGRYPVTQGQWQQIMDNNPSWFKSGDDFPVECVSWMDAQKFITEISKRTGHRFSLSTEAQWEYASRSGGKKQAFAGGHDVDVMAWFRGKKGARTFKIGILSANDLGIHDLGRNVWEWCEDVYDSDAYFKHVRNNPVITAGGDFRVCRGGTKDYNPRGVRAAIRFSFSKDFRFSLLGFRITKEE